MSPFFSPLSHNVDLSARACNVYNSYLFFSLYRLLFEHKIFNSLKGGAHVKNLVMLRSELTSLTFALTLLGKNAKVGLACVVLIHSSPTHFLVYLPKSKGLRRAKYQNLLLVWKYLVDLFSMPACLLCC